MRTKLRYTSFKSHIFDLLPLLQLLQSNCVFRLKILVTVIRSKKLKLNLCTYYINTRGGVEDTRLEAKNKDTKKIRGQGQEQPFRGQTLSWPRTGMLEAKAKDQRHKGKCSPPQKKVFKIFFMRSQKKTVFINFFRWSPKKTVQKKIYWQICRILTIQKIVLSSSRGQANFWGLEASRPRPRTSKRVLEAKHVLEDSTTD